MLNGQTTDSLGWTADKQHCECDRCHNMAPTCSVDFWDGSGDWDYCQLCWAVLAEQGAFDNHWI